MPKGNDQGRLMPEKIVDACCLINLYAAGNTLRILTVFGGELHVHELVKNEALGIRKPDDEEPERLVPGTIDLTEALEAGLLRECRLEGPSEAEDFVRFASVLDDGEAACLAIAKSRGWSVATDDRKAIRVATEAEVATITTPELVRCWVDATKPADDEIADALRRIERLARFRPRRASPWFEWWVEMVER